MLPAAAGVAISPFPIIGFVLFVGTPRGRVNGPAFVLGCALGIALVGAIVLLTAGRPLRKRPGGACHLGLRPPARPRALLVLAALKQWRGRLRAGEEVPTPKWMTAVDGFGPPKAFGAGLVLGGINPKNLLLTVAGAASIAQTGIPAGEQALALAIFVVIGCLGVTAPVAIAFGMGDRSRALLDEIKTGWTRNNTAIMVVILALIGAKLIGGGIGGFSP